MTATIIQFPKPFNPVRVEITSPGILRDGQCLYFVDYVEGDGGRCSMWDGIDIDEAREAARECAGSSMDVVDLAGVGLSRH